MDIKTQDLHLEELKKLQSILQQKNQCVCLKKNAASNTLRNGDYKKIGVALDLSSLNGILSFDHLGREITVEPRITFETLCDFTFAHSLIPPVVPEFRSITVGGAVMGAALESSSHIYGQFNDICVEYELLLGSGKIIVASALHNADLFYGISGSYGTLAILTAIKLRLIPAKKWVRISYSWFDNPQQAVEMLTNSQPAHFIEGIAYSQEKAVVIRGVMEDEPTAHIFRQNRPWHPWYVQHILQTKHQEECMAIEDYLFRLDRGAFWMGRYIHSVTTMLRLLLHLGIPKINNHPLNPSFLFRFLFGWFFSSEKLYALWHRVPNQIAENLFFIHDFYTPFEKAQETLRHFIDKTHIFPIWLCPIKGTQSPQFFSPHFGSARFLNIGLYGIPQKKISIPCLSAQLEKEILSFGGRKMLYSFTYYDEATFSKIYFQESYNKLRNKYDAENVFPTLFNKITKKMI